jgi:hypothetical protein
MLHRKSDLNQENKLLIYKQIIRPSMCYASTIINSAAKTNMKRLQIIQNKIIKICINVPWFTSTDFIHEITNIETIQEFNNKNYEKFMSKL